MRIAGVNVGKVISVERDGNAAKVTFTVDDAGRPVPSDAFVEIRPRIFLEGNYFLDLDPGSPSAPKLPSGATIPITHTATAVQFDEILTSLQAPQREPTSARVLEGTAPPLTHSRPRPRTHAGPAGPGRDRGGRRSTGPSPTAARPGRASAQVTEAFLGTEPHDLSRLIAARRRPSRARRFTSDSSAT